jgi:hypothetical protein
VGRAPAKPTKNKIYNLKMAIKILTILLKKMDLFNNLKKFRFIFIHQMVS